MIMTLVTITINVLNSVSHVPSTILSTLSVLAHFIPHNDPMRLVLFVWSILELTQLRNRKVKHLIQSYTAREYGTTEAHV